MPKVSVIIPTYNRAESLRSAITSVLNQTFQDFEVIVVDDASRDHTSEVVTAAGDKRIRSIHHDTNKGVAAARNTGVLNSNGKYLAFLDDDDEWLPKKLQMQVDLLEGSPTIIGGVHTESLAIEESSKKILFKLTPEKKGNIFKQMFVRNWIGPTSTVVLRKQCFDEVGLFDVSIDYGEDYDMWLRISKEFEFAYIEEPLAKICVHENKPSLSRNYETMIRGREALLEKHRPLLVPNRKAHSRRYLELAEIYCYSGNVRKGREALLTAIKLYPLEIRHYYNLCLSLLGADNFKRFKEVKEKLMSKCHF